MTDPLPDNDVVHLPEPARRPPHVFGEPVTILAELSISGHEQHERTCKTCGAVKITVIGEGDHHRRAWRKNALAEQIETFAALPCEPSIGAGP